MKDIAICVPFFSRVDKLENLLKSIDDKKFRDENITVYIADNGQETPSKESLYDTKWSFDLTVFDLEYDSGIGNCRKQLVERTSEDILFFIDPDMTIPHNYQILIDQLMYRDDLGAVSGLLLEGSRIYTTAADIETRNNTIYIDHNRDKVVDTLAESYFVSFDFIPQVGAFRRECVKEYNWDESYRTLREHIDFFLGHKRNTDWQFGITPEVLFPHFPGGSNSYESHRHSRTKHRESKAHFQKKFDCDGLKNLSQPWIDTYPYYRRQSRVKMLSNQLRNDGIISTISKVIGYLRYRLRV